MIMAFIGGVIVGTLVVAGVVFWYIKDWKVFP